MASEPEPLFADRWYELISADELRKEIVHIYAILKLAGLAVPVGTTPPPSDAPTPSAPPPVAGAVTYSSITVTYSGGTVTYG